MFPLLLGLKYMTGKQQVSGVVENHLEGQRRKLRRVCRPFECKGINGGGPFPEPHAQMEHWTLGQQEELCELQSNHSVRMGFADLPRHNFWNSVKEVCFGHSQECNKYFTVVFNI